MLLRASIASRQHLNVGKCFVKTKHCGIKPNLSLLVRFKSTAGMLQLSHIIQKLKIIEV